MEQGGFRLDINWPSDVGMTLEEITKGYLEITQVLRKCYMSNVTPVHVCGCRK